MNKTLTLIAMLFFAVSSWAQKSIYVPTSWQQQSTGVYYEASSNITWKKTNSKESDNFIVYWDDKYTTAPNKLSTSSAYYVDIDDLLAKAEAFYELECSTLGFVNPATSNISKYKIIICLNYTTDWVCTGAGYDFQVPALWLSPNTCKPVGSAVAHEVGHSFHYMCYSEASKQGTLAGVETGFHSAIGNGATIWETTANWQALQSYPNEFFTESGMQDVFAMSHNYAFTHEWHRYQAYPFFYYLCDKYNDIKTIANVWNYSETTKRDFNQVLMDYKGLKASEFYEMYYDFATKCVTWEFSPITVPSSQIGNFKYNCIQTATNTYQVAYSSCPQSTGFNVIPLTGFRAGTQFSIDFTSLANKAPLAANDPKQYMNDETRYTTTTATTYNNMSGATRRGFRVGFVAQLRDGSCQYYGGDTRICTGSGESTQTLTCTPPTNVSKMWMVVVPAPSSYIQHAWDEDISNDDQFPYKFKINSGVKLNTTKATVTQGSEVSNDNEMTFDLELERTIGKEYGGDNVDITATLANALEFLGASSVSECTVAWVNPDGTKIVDYAGYDGWARADGTAAYWGDNTAVCVKFQPDINNLWVCTFPGTDTTEGTTYTTTYALTKGTKTAYITLTTTLATPKANPISAYEIVGTYDYVAEAYPDNTFAPTYVNISADTPTMASLLGLADITSCTYFATAEDGGLTSTFTAGPGYWFGENGIPTNYGNNSVYYVETDYANTLNFGQYPGANKGGETYTATVYFGNETTKKLVQLNLTYKIKEQPLESLVIDSKVFTYTLSAKPNHNFTTQGIDLTQDAAEIASLIGEENLNSAVFYTLDAEGNYTSSYTANNGYFFSENNTSIAYGADARYYIETDKATTLSVGQMPNTNKGGEQYTATLFFGSRSNQKAVQINVTYNILSYTLGDFTVAAEKSYEASAKPNSGYAQTSINITEDVAELEAALGIELAAAKLFASNSETTITDATTANGGFWFDANGMVTSYGNNSTFFIESAEGFTQFNIGQFPGAFNGGEENKAVLYLVNDTDLKLVKLNFTYTIEPFALSDINIVKTYDIEVSDNYKTRFGTPKSENINKEEILAALSLEDITLNNLYGKTDDENGFTSAKTANLGFFFNGNGTVQPYGDGCKLFVELIIAEEGTTLSIDQFPGGMKPEETQTAILYIVNQTNHSGVQININYSVNKLSIGYVTEKINAMMNGDTNVEMFDIETLVNTILNK